MKRLESASIPAVDIQPQPLQFGCFARTLSLSRHQIRSYRLSLTASFATISPGLWRLLPIQKPSSNPDAIFHEGSLFRGRPRQSLKLSQPATAEDRRNGRSSGMCRDRSTWRILQSPTPCGSRRMAGPSVPSATSIAAMHSTALTEAADQPRPWRRRRLSGALAPVDADVGADHRRLLVAAGVPLACPPGPLRAELEVLFLSTCTERPPGWLDRHPASNEQLSKITITLINRLYFDALINE
jgi:hypothetical protein